MENLKKYKFISERSGKTLRIITSEYVLTERFIESVSIQLGRQYGCSVSCEKIS
jgi:hypothetical protein